MKGTGNQGGLVGWKGEGGRRMEGNGTVCKQREGKER